MSQGDGEITQLLQAWRGGDEQALDKLTPQVYRELHLADERKSKVVELRFFGGLSVEETVEVLQVSPDTVARDWWLANAWLSREMSGDAYES